MEAIFLNVSETVCYRSEYDGLEEASESSEYVRMYRSLLDKVARPHFQIIPFLTDDREIIERVNKEAWF